MERDHVNSRFYAERDVDKLERRIELLEQRLVDLAAQCWPNCGTDFAKDLAQEIKDLKVTR